MLSAPLYLWASYSGGHSYDHLFRREHARWLAWHDEDWLYLKAQGWAESGLQPSALSSAGAAGLMQFLPGTWNDCLESLGIKASRYSAPASIKCGGWYMAKRLRGLTAPRSTIERWRWAWGAYNWGFGNILRAQERAGGSTRWADLRVPVETAEYVGRIERTRERYARQCD